MKCRDLSGPWHLRSFNCRCDFILLLAFLGVFAVGSSSTGTVKEKNTILLTSANPLLDWLLGDRVFETKPTEFTIIGQFENDPLVESRDTFWVNSIAGGIEPKRHRYFTFRPASDPAQHAVDIVFFAENAEGFYFGVPRVMITELDSNKMVLFSVGTGGGEGGVSTVTESHELKVNEGADGIRSLSAAISSQVSRSSIWNLYRPRKSSWHATMQFAQADVPDSLLTAAKKISMSHVEYNKLEEERLLRERKERFKR
jgi:hypothetical protein